MAVHDLLSMAAILALVITNLYKAASASGHRRIGLAGGQVNTAVPATGICSVATIIHGYKCQEYHV